MGFQVKYRIYFDRNKTIYTRLTIVIIIVVIIIRLTILINMEKKLCLNFDRKIRQIEQCALQ